MSVRMSASVLARSLAAIVSIALGSAASADSKFLRIATYAAGDEAAAVVSYSDAVLTEYRFEAGGHTYALSRSLRGVDARDLIFIDDRLACVYGKRRYSSWLWGGDRPSLFWSDRHIWEEPVAKWEWVYEPGGLEYLAAMLREACGLEVIQERRVLTADWGRRSETPEETKDRVSKNARDVAGWFMVWGPVCAFAGGYCPSYEPPYELDKFARIDRREVEQFVWSLPLGIAQEEIPAALGVPDAEYVWPSNGTVVQAYRLGSLSRFFIGLVDGRVAWIHAEYPGLILQAKIAASELAGSGP